MKTAAEIATAAGGVVGAGDPEATVGSWAFDSRALQPGACFVALRAERDGHDFVGAAFAAGASVAMVDAAMVDAAASLVAPPPGAAIVVVDDVIAGLQAVAAADRRARRDLRVVGVGGSTGKTSTKDLLAAVLAPLGGYASPASHNNEFGLPITLLNTPADAGIVVAEMGERFAGDVAALCAIAQPEIGVVTNVGLAHAEHLGGPAGAAAAIGELVEALPASGLAVLNADNEWTPALAARSRARVVTAGRSASADFRIERVGLDGELRPTFTMRGHRVEVPLHGEHQAENAALALVVAHEGFGVDLGRAASSMRSARPASWRMELHRTRDDIVLLNDAYNANPASMEAALHTLSVTGVSGRRIAVLGDMRELGPYAEEAHAAIGRRAAELVIDIVIGVGAGGRVIVEAAGSGQLHAAADAAEATRILIELIGPGDAVLIKASRGVGLERVAAAVLARDVTAHRGVPS